MPCVVASYLCLSTTLSGEVFLERNAGNVKRKAVPLRVAALERVTVKARKCSLTFGLRRGIGCCMAMTEEQKQAWREQHEREQQESAARKKAEREQKRVERARRRDAKMQSAADAVATVPEAAPPAALAVPAVPDGAAVSGAVAEVQQEVLEAEKLRVQRKTARFFEDVMNDPAEQTRDRLNAAQGLARLYGLGREEVSVTVSPSEAWLQAHLAAAAAEQKPWLRGGK